MKVHIHHYADDTYVTVILNGMEYDIRVEGDDVPRYNVAAVCVLAGYRNVRRALNRLVKHDCIGSTDELLETGYASDSIVRDLLRLAPCHYSSKLVRLFDERVFNPKSSPESRMKRRTVHKELETKVDQILERVTSLEGQLAAANAELKTAREEERHYYEDHGVKDCYDFESEYETDYESTTDEDSDATSTDLSSDDDNTTI